MKTLHLNLKAKWYDMIESGVKKEEYREIKPYWMKRLCDSCIEAGVISCFDDMSTKKYDLVTFHYGYTKRNMTYKIEYIKIHYGNVDWGAELGKMYFVIKLGERV